MKSGFFSCDKLNITRLSTAALCMQLRYYKRAMKNSRFILLILCIFVKAPIAFAQDTYRVYGPNRFDFYLKANYFNTNSNYDANGGKVALATGGSLQTLRTEASLRYVLLGRTGLVGGVEFGNVESNNGTQVRTQSAMTSYLLGLDLSIYKSKSWALYADGLFKNSNENINVNGDEALASDGANEIIGKITGLYTGADFRAYTSLGGNFRSDGLSTLMIYSFGADYNFSGFRVGLNFEGSSTVKDDEQTATPVVRDTLTNRVNAGSRRYYSVNPNYLEGQLVLGYSFDKNLNFSIYGGPSLVGSNSAQGISAGAKLNWGFETEAVKTSTSEVVEQTPDSITEPGFKVDTEDGVNQDLFKNTAPVPPSQNKK